MAKATALQVMTANRLRDGEVVYWRGGAWVGELAEAELFADEVDAKSALESAARFVRERIVVNPYLFAVARDEAGVRPLEERERIRAAGPTIRRDLGKQAKTKESNPPPEGGSKNSQRSEEFFGEGSSTGGGPLPELLRNSTLPQGEGRGIGESFHVSL